MYPRLLLIPLTLAASFAAPATAAPRSVAVSYADLDLSRPAGVAALDRRLSRAADAVCGPVDARDLRASAAARACRTAALSAAAGDAKAVIAARRGPDYAMASSGVAAN